MGLGNLCDSLTTSHGNHSHGNHRPIIRDSSHEVRKLSGPEILVLKASAQFPQRCTDLIPFLVSDPEFLCAILITS